jgi:hypothetical protein
VLVLCSFDGAPVSVDRVPFKLPDIEKVRVAAAELRYQHRTYFLSAWRTHKIVGNHFGIHVVAALQEAPWPFRKP